MNQELPHSLAPSAAEAALAAGRLVVARSFRLHRPRGAFCHAGWCQQCRVTLLDGRIDLACRTSDTPRQARGGWRRLVGRLSERLPPWFYEHRLLWREPEWGEIGRNVRERQYLRLQSNAQGVVHEGPALDERGWLSKLNVWKRTGRNSMGLIAV